MRSIVMLLLMIVTVAAQAKTRVYLKVTPDGSMIAQQFGFELKERILGSPAFELTDAPADAVIGVFVSALAVGDGATQVAYSLSIVTGDFFIASTVGACSQQNLPHCETAVLAATDHEVPAAIQIIARERELRHALSH